MPGPVSYSSKGPGDRTPYVPSWCYPNNRPRQCPCGHHEGYHNDSGACLLGGECECLGLPAGCLTPIEEMP
jgi:hypothetical protein